jgi:hypothetical protein
MGLVQNLKKILKKLVTEYFSREKFFPSTKQREELTSKRQDNSSSTESSPNPLTQEDQRTTIVTSSADTSEKIIMERTTEPVPVIREWSIGRIHELADGDIEAQFNAVAIAEEFDEWINIPPDQEELTYLSIEPEEWTEDQEIDTI